MVSVHFFIWFHLKVTTNVAMITPILLHQSPCSHPHHGRGGGGGGGGAGSVGGGAVPPRPQHLVPAAQPARIQGRPHARRPRALRGPGPGCGGLRDPGPQHRAVARLQHSPAQQRSPRLLAGGGRGHPPRRRGPGRGHRAQDLGDRQTGRIWRGNVCTEVPNWVCVLYSFNVLNPHMILAAWPAPSPTPPPPR